MVAPGQLTQKWKRGGEGGRPARITLELESTPDLLAEGASRRRPGQVLVGFALEPRDRLMESAREKLARKGVDAIVANPLETMDGDSIEAVVLGSDGSEVSTRGTVSKRDFAPWLLDVVTGMVGRASRRAAR